ncbi:MAG: molybdate ABC transporter substrate-binding protein [Ectothiorhodospiraceae bacterium]|nr:molybdate ABC transporter substrate-binding protein [Ectothiorhodospiraceae bacterium]
MTGCGRRRLGQTLLALLLLGAASVGWAAEARLAIAANFTAAAREIVAAFEAATGHRVVASFGSTGALYTQITQRAPYHVFLAADQVRPALAEREGLAVPGTRFTYATGRLVLFSREPDLVTGEATLRAGTFTKLAVANPITAPYGAAAVEVLRALGIYQTVERRLVLGTNIAQTYQFVETGNAELGLVAASQVAERAGGSRWLVPQSLHSVIAQDAVLLTIGAENPAAVAFLAFLRSGPARAVIARHGYAVAE